MLTRRELLSSALAIAGLPKLAAPVVKAEAVEEWMSKIAQQEPIPAHLYRMWVEGNRRERANWGLSIPPQCSSRPRAERPA